VSIPRKVRAIYQQERKSDRRDALMLAADLADGSPRCSIPFATGSEEAHRICCGSNCVTVCACARGLDQFGSLYLRAWVTRVSNPSSERFPQGGDGELTPKWCR